MVLLPFVIRNDNTHALLAGAKNIGVNSITVVECLALRDGLAHVVHHGWRNIIIEEMLYPWSILQLLQDVSHLASFCNLIKLKHAFREANSVADALASLSHSMTPSKLWVDSLPLSVFNSFYLDLFGPAFPFGSRFV
ncbi:PREDICTED: Ribonuclease H domain [Prunus dulcis]|uniref:PREDICTED: Ribonuclease H domain n=1 Tax=Prunus dulcis TaxID=3755 RepID=A0A5E4G3L2_PRUDU|nr:PREDICTED: Ribonuclease H domain [Prunus dulcis]